MNRNTGVVKTFGARFPRKQVLPIAFGYVRSNSVKDVKDFVVTVRTSELEQAAAHGQDNTDAFIFAQVVLNNTKEAAATGATKICLEHNYLSIKVNHTHTRLVVKGFFR